MAQARTEVYRESLPSHLAARLSRWAGEHRARREERRAIQKMLSARDVGRATGARF